MTTEVLTGKWIMRDGRAVGDETCQQIERLIVSYLKPIGHDKSGWYTLFRDIRDDRLWERSYPQSPMHGGGPPRLAQISVDEARLRYGDFPA
jgi:hypothetical protein